MALVQSGKLRALAVTGNTRFSGAPDIPTVSESGVPGYEAETWFGIAAPAGTPELIVNRLAAALAKVMHSNDVRNTLESGGAKIIASSPGEFSRRIKSDTANWREVIGAAKISLD